MKFIQTLLTLTLLAGFALVLTCGCTKKETGPEQPALTELSPDQQKQKQRAVMAKDKMFNSLLGELGNALGTQGPAKSITICKERAPAIAKEVSEETGVKIGRTSFKLRNQDNTAPGWAAYFVNTKVEEEVAVELPDNGLGVLMPIRLQTVCTTCHGKQIMPDLKAAIVSNYPEDQATGFEVDDIRGYFWIEVPAEK